MVRDLLGKRKSIEIPEIKLGIDFFSNPIFWIMETSAGDFV